MQNMHFVLDAQPFVLPGDQQTGNVICSGSAKLELMTPQAKSNKKPLNAKTFWGLVRIYFLLAGCVQ